MPRLRRPRSSLWWTSEQQTGDAPVRTPRYCLIMSSPANLFIDAASRVQQWVRDRPFIVDVTVATFGVLLSLTDLFAIDEMPARDADAIAVLLILAAAALLILRRVAPFTVFVVILSIMAAMYVRDYDTYLSGLGLPAIYTVVVLGEPRRKAWTFVTTGCFAIFAVACATLLQGDTGFSIANATGMVTFLLATVVAGVIVRNRHEIFLDTEARAERAEADQLATAQRAVAKERLRIAQEMHDVVAHGMSVIAVQAAAAKESFETRPDRTYELLDSIELTGRESLVEMRRMLGVLRNSQDQNAAPGQELAPQPSLADLERLVVSCTEAGTPTELRVTGERGRVPPGIDLAAFRIVQEALTNVLKHGGTNASARVELAYEPTQIQISVLDTGRGTIVTPALPGSGNGLIGMRERIDAYGGELSAGPRPGGGYAVIATLPLETKNGWPRVESTTDSRETTL